MMSTVTTKACSVKHCPHAKPKNIISPVTLYPPPEDLYFQKLWVRASGKRFIGKVGTFAICHLHFGKEDFEIVDGLKKLKKTAVPSLNLPRREEEEDDSIIPPTDLVVTRERYNLLLLEYELLEERVKRQEETLIGLKTENSTLNKRLK